MVHRIVDDANSDNTRHPNEQNPVLAEQAECAADGNERTYHGCRRVASIFTGCFVTWLGCASGFILAHLIGNVAILCCADAIREDVAVEKEMDLRGLTYLLRRRQDVEHLMQ